MHRGVNGPDKRWRRVRRLVLWPSVAGFALAGGAGVLAGAGFAEAFFEEFGGVEVVQLIAWVVAALAMTVALTHAPTRRDTWNTAWLLTLCVLAIARELDLHELIDADHWRSFGVSFMLNWWTDPAVSLVRKLMWAGVGMAVLAMLAVPPLMVRAPVVTMLRRADSAFVLIVAAFAWLAFGYAADDLLGRGQFVSEPASKAAEEMAELVGAAFFAAAMAAELRRPLSGRMRVDDSGVEPPSAPPDRST
jgi:hypothetical protein